MTTNQYPLPSTTNPNQTFAQWDKQANDPQVAYINLNNLYLSVERGETKMSITIQNELYHLLSIAYPFRTEETMNSYWLAEFEKLPNWFKY